MQRVFDVIFSGVALILLSPLFLPIMLLLRLTGEGEIFFLQNRVGRGGRHFKLYKFATMLKNSPNIGMGTVTVKGDPRILPFGVVLRKTKINELPQLFNILKGDMSLIGPRPQTQRCFDAFPISAQHEIKKVRPGLSGIGSIIFRNEENMMDAQRDPGKFYDEIIMPFKGALECWYVSNRSIGLYFSLICVTAWVVLSSNLSLVWLMFTNLPKPPSELKRELRFID